MPHIAYIHINRHDVLENVGMRLDPRYDIRAEMLPLRDYEMHLTRYRVTIGWSSGIEDGFYGEHIQCLTAIVGNNGAGKTSALRFLLNAVVSGSGHDISGFVVTAEPENGRLCVYHSEDVRVDIDAQGMDVQEEGGWPEIDTLVYGGHTNILTSVEDIMSVELQGMVNVTEGCLLTMDLQHYGREMATNGMFPLRDYATAYDAQNHWRVCNFLAQYNGPLKQLLHLPNYVQVFPNKAGQWSLKHRLNPDDHTDYPTLQKSQDWTFREFRLAELIYYSIINYISDGIGEQNYWQGYLDAWNLTVSEQYQGDVVRLFRQFVDSRQLPERNEYRVLLEYIHEVIENISVHCLFDERSQLHCFCFQLDDDNDAMRTFLGWLQGNPIFIACRYFDLRYAHHYDSGSILSSGEKAMLDMYSRIYDTLITKHQHDSNYRWPTLYVLDEAELGFHPEWQRVYVKNLTLFLEEMAVEASNLYRNYHRNAPDFKFQIILSSHSPIILSDVPQKCVVMLKREGDRISNVTATRPQTFGTNIFELYRDSFFLEGGLVGEFAQDFIRSLSEEIDGLQNPTAEALESVRKRIELIGDRNIKAYLMQQIEPMMDRQSRISYYQSKIAEMENEPD